MGDRILLQRFWIDVEIAPLGRWLFVLQMSLV